jgi:hypothetical protein
MSQSGKLDSQFSEQEIKARRELVLTHLGELMKSVGRGKHFKDSDSWLDTLVERPKRAQQA